MKTQEKIKKLEQEVAVLWQVLDDERLWHPSIVLEIRKRSCDARKNHAHKRLKTAQQVFASL